MDTPKVNSKKREWLERYVPAEILGTASALTAAVIVYGQTHSYAAAAASGWVGEGIVFYGYFIITELLVNHKKYSQHRFIKRISLAIKAASTNLIIEFVPAEILDNFIIRPFAMYLVPQYIHPYALGFLLGKFGSDILFYLFAVLGYETRKKWLRT